jgi:excinuclease ABC subunit A
VLHSGVVEQLRDVEESLTRPFLFGERDVVVRRAAPRDAVGRLTLANVTRHNLRDVTLELPLGVLTAVTGVSGSGKSTLVTQVLATVVSRHLGEARVEPGDGEELDAAVEIDDPARGVSADGLEQVDRIVSVDQRPIGRTPRSNLATYTGLFDGVRRLFAGTDAAKARGWSAGRFSFNVEGGRCETCQGEGFVAVELMFLPGTYARCETCGGSRYAAETLEVTWNGLTIADVLALTVDEALEHFVGERAIARSLRTLADIGLGYLRLGQPATELSGGEAQRIKLASELQRARRGHALYILDEPTTGLHPADVELLVRQLHALADAGHTVVVVEHDMGVVAGADHVIDLGPGAGDEGGRIVATGTPAQVAASADSRTARFLRPRL